ncbi:hypothetical protein AB6A40_003655 [Gnathostoma spinigerum]|uniref:Fungal lipase-type domain-containing protein n=1 Tax=Gnathostoma spinigerum TaxID=75299 RepID=A0ABD6EHT4_9BILA
MSGHHGRKGARKRSRQQCTQDRKDYPDHSIVFTGHSLGGAIASVASIKYAWTRFGNSTLSDIILITFGQPRVGNMDFAVAHDRLIPHSFRIVHRYDLVAHLPFCYETLRSHSCMSLRNHGPYHHGTEIWYPNDMTNISLYRICTSLPRNEDDTCSNSQYAHFNIDDHTFYYNEHVSEYGKRGCLPIRDRHRYHTDVIEKYHIDYVVLYP